MVVLSKPPSCSSSDILALQDRFSAMSDDLTKGVRTFCHNLETHLQVEALFREKLEDFSTLEKPGVKLESVVTIASRISSDSGDLNELFSERAEASPPKKKAKKDFSCGPSTGSTLMHISKRKAKEDDSVVGPKAVSTTGHLSKRKAKEGDSAGESLTDEDRIQIRRFSILNSLASLQSALTCLRGAAFRQEELVQFSLGISKGPSQMDQIIADKKEAEDPGISQAFTIKYFTEMKYVSSLIEKHFYKVLGFEIRQCFTSGNMPEVVFQKLILVLILNNKRICDAFLRNDQKSLSAIEMLELEEALEKVKTHELFLEDGFKADFQKEIIFLFKHINNSLKVEMLEAAFQKLIREGYSPEVDDEACRLFIGIWEYGGSHRALGLLEILWADREHKFLSDICKSSQAAKALIDERMKIVIANRPSAEEQREIDAFQWRVAVTEAELTEEVRKRGGLDSIVFCQETTEK